MLQSLVPEVEHIAPPVLEKLYLPPYTGPDDHDDVQPLLNLVRWRQPKVVLELGTAYGATVANICSISDATVFTVNALPEQIAGNLTTFALSREEIGYVYRKCGFQERVVQLYENTRCLDFAQYIPTESVDMAIIDACHDADFVVSDFLKIQPVLAARSFVLLHDVHPGMQGHLADSYIACMYLRKLGFNVRHIAKTWWGFWEAADAKTPALQRMYGAVDNALIRMRKRQPTEDVLTLRWLSSLYTIRHVRMS